MSIDQQIKEISDQLSALVKALIDRIKALPDNPRVKRITKSCFVVSSKDLGDNWSYKYHDFILQYNAVIAAIQKTNPLHAVDKLRSIVTAGEIRQPGITIVRLHPDVIANL